MCRHNLTVKRSDKKKGYSLSSRKKHHLGDITTYLNLQLISRMDISIHRYLYCSILKYKYHTIWSTTDQNSIVTYLQTLRWGERYNHYLSLPHRRPNRQSTTTIICYLIVASISMLSLAITITLKL